MRDFRDAKAMAKTLRAVLAAKGLKITVSQSLELIAELFGVVDWNTLAAAIRQKVRPPAEDGSLGVVSHMDRKFFSRELELTMHRAVAAAGQRNHEFATLEHLLLALTDDADAAAVMKACKVNPGAIKQRLSSYIDNDLKTLAIDDGRDTELTTAFQRVVQHAIFLTQNRHQVTGRDLLMALLHETESYAAWLLGEQGMMQQDAAKVVRGNEDEDAAVRRRQVRPVEVEKIKRPTAARPQGKRAKGVR